MILSYFYVFFTFTQINNNCFYKECIAMSYTKLYVAPLYIAYLEQMNNDLVLYEPKENNWIIIIKHKAGH